MSFLHSFEQQLAIFEPYLTQKITLTSGHFSDQNKLVQDFVNEIRCTIALLTQQESANYAEHYAIKLVQQFDSLHKAVVQLKVNPTRTFQSTYHFPKNIHHLPLNKRLIEYKKALRALNEKISWLIEQRLQAISEEKKYQFHQMIIDTEYRKQKCLTAIEELEEKMLFRA